MIASEGCIREQRGNSRQRPRIGSLPRCGREAVAKCTVDQNFFERVHHRVDVADADDASVLSVYRELRNRTNVGRHRRTAARHCLERRQSKSFVSTRIEQDGCR
jgi:hypothetical protein